MTSKRHESFPNIPLTPLAERIGAELQAEIVAHPHVLPLLQKRTQAIMPEMADLLRKRNDAPETISDADRRRITELTSEVYGILQELLKQAK